ncbi:uncharacterized protein LOC562056 [Danio rerio]|uniref:Uncharacterized protein LOC562056 n=1 Tax=Danio rerio TaxID=7955 RepID=A8KB19_DANRE|nr:uncharacterized protein LOC562056 [Danio rerio]AAI53930.1 Zgc:171459 protein [Danio rerio]|eukprot:NP_001104635.1 uncharacterized protein LOC562056 [Danio rerio]
MESAPTTSKLIYKMSDEGITKLIQPRSSNSALFDGRKNSSKTAWSAILREMGLDERMTTEQMAKKWENLKARYKDARYPPSGVEKNPTCWKWFNLMDGALGKEFDDKISQQVIASEPENNTTPHTGKRLRQIKVGGEILEYLEEEGSSVNIPPPSRTHKPGTQKGKQLITEGHSLDIMRSRLQRERQLLEKELGGLDREKALLERERALAARERAALQRDRVQVEKDRAAANRDKASLEQDRARLQKDREALVNDRAALERNRRSTDFTNHVKSSSGCNGPGCPHEKNREKLIFLLERVIEKI